MTMQVLSKVGGAGALVVGIADQLLLNTDGTVLLGQDAPTGNRTLQLATMKKFADEFGALMTGTTGWQKLPSGLIVQWGIVSTLSSGDTTVSYPIAFPTAVKSVVGTAGSGTVFMAFCTNGTTTTSFLCNANSAGGRNAASCSWMAIGY